VVSPLYYEYYLRNFDKILIIDKSSDCVLYIRLQICREQFVSLHSQPILEDLSRSFEAKFAYDSDALSGETDENKRAAKEFVNYVLRRIPVQGKTDKTYHR